jgi:hypothetical protein
MNYVYVLDSENDKLIFIYKYDSNLLEFSDGDTIPLFIRNNNYKVNEILDLLK